MKIAIDIDNTWTKNVRLWKTFLFSCLGEDVEIVFVTGRDSYTEDLAKYDLGKGGNKYIWVFMHKMMKYPIVYCGVDENKNDVCLRQGHIVDVWIDDSPEKIKSGFTACKSEEL